MTEEKPEYSTGEKEDEKPSILIEFDGVDSCNLKIKPTSNISLAQMELAAFRLNTLTIRAVNDKYTHDTTQQTLRSEQMRSIMRDAKLKA